MSVSGAASEAVSLDRVTLEWRDGVVEAVADEWIVGLPTPEPTRDGEGEIIDFNVDPEWGKVAKPALAAGLAALPLGGVAFAGYLGVEHVFKVIVPENIAADPVEAALRRLPGVAYAEPNLIGEVHGTTPNDPNFGSQD